MGSLNSLRLIPLPPPEQVNMIQDHLKLVFRKETLPLSTPPHQDNTLDKIVWPTENNPWTLPPAVYPGHTFNHLSRPTIIC